MPNCAMLKQVIDTLVVNHCAMKVNLVHYTRIVCSEECVD